MTSPSVPISIPYPQVAEPVLRLRLGPCRLRVVPSDGPEWITGTYDDEGSALPIAVRVDGGTATIAQSFEPGSFSSTFALPQLDLAIDRKRPFGLVIETGAGENAFDLGGLPIVSLELRAGAGKFDLDFSAANPIEMRSIELSAGAGTLNVRRLANANFASLHLGSGVAACTLDFAGDLRRHASARLDAGLASIEIAVPATTAMRVRTKSFAANTGVIGPITRSGDDYSTAPALAGAHPLLAIEASIALGQLTIRANL